MPQLGETVEGFEALVLEGEELQSSQDVYRSKLSETVVRSKDILRRGRSFRNRLVAGAQSVFGVESSVLLELGAKPRLRREEVLRNRPQARRTREKRGCGSPRSGLRVSPPETMTCDLPLIPIC
jgi:hypothetical protein